MAAQNEPLENGLGNSGKFESDTQKLSRKHLSDPNHQITDEELKQVRVGMSPGADEPTREAVSEAEERIADAKADSEEDTLPGAQKITPWDTVD